MANNLSIYNPLIKDKKLLEYNNINYNEYTPSIVSNVRRLTRKGPTRVWSDYKTLRVPTEIFEEVREFMQRKKLEFRAKKEGLVLENIPLTGGELELEERTRRIVEQIISEKGLSVSSPRTPTQSTPGVLDFPRDMTARDTVEEYLKNNPSREFSNTQLSKILGIPGPTVREATRTIAQENSNFVLRSGRPNKIVFNG